MLDHQKVVSLERRASVGEASSISTSALVAMSAGALLGGYIGLVIVTEVGASGVVGTLLGGVLGASLGLALLPAKT